MYAEDWSVIMTGREVLWQQAVKKCVNDYGIETKYSRDHGMDCEYDGDWDCEECWDSEVVEGHKEGEMDLFRDY